MTEKTVIRCCNCKDCIEEPDGCDMSDRITCPTCRETWTRMFWITPDFQFDPRFPVSEKERIEMRERVAKLTGCLMLCMMMLFVGCKSAEQGSETVVEAKEVPQFSLAWSEYPSWSAFGVAHEVGILNGEAGKQSELEKKWGVDVVLLEKDYDTCIQYASTGTADAACLTNIDILAPSLGRPMRFILPTSTSNGADAVISVETTDVTGLKGKEVYGLAQTVSEYLFERGLEIKGQNPADYSFKGMDPAVAAQSMVTNSPNVKNICVWNPFKMSTLEKRDDAKVVFDSTLITGEIIDGVGVGEDAMKREGGENFCRCICEAYYEVCKLLNNEATRDKTLVMLGAKFSDLEADKMAICTVETKFYDTPEAGEALLDNRSEGALLQDTMNRVVKFCVDKGVCTTEPVVTFGKPEPKSNLTFDSSYLKSK